MCRVLACLFVFAIGCGKKPDDEKVALTTQTSSAQTKKRNDPPQLPSAKPESPKADPEPPKKTPPALKPAPKSTEEESVARFLELYLSTPFAERGKYVADPAEYEEVRAAYYKGVPMPQDPKVTVTELAKGPRPGYLTATTTVTVTPRTAISARSSSVTWYLVKSSEGLKLDWSAFAGYNPVGHKVWAAGTDESRTARVKIKLDDYYNFHYDRAKLTHYSIACEERSGDSHESFQGYVPKDSDLGRELFKILKDGHQHQVILTIQRTGRETKAVGITNLVSETWVFAEGTKK